MITLMSAFISMGKGYRGCCELCRSIEEGNVLFLFEKRDTLKIFLIQMKSLIREVMNLLQESDKMMRAAVFCQAEMEKING